ncbi:MAG TPA: MurR/RpiR family transcriptional regulator [Blastocatellia bacterium]|nr:MurR/RpiR family transcriptional regulator [Blastocatellia bacterium]HMX25087.1 MurR/RpiR family transcriptional regulator [Blastocatellia bacterium]HMZ17799.1 MurR/RpiR family transcriptional regulator [Blastocatellia bacterium]HNG30742.1 MurR/RpiR family transcriptional regulator [Blastocatellia bacterium]
MKKTKVKTEASPQGVLEQDQNVKKRLTALHPRRQEAIRPVLEHPREYVLLSIHDLAVARGVSAATMLRTVLDLGFAGYKEFRGYLHRLATVTSTPLDLMKAAPASEASGVTLLKEALEVEAKNIQGLRTSLDYEKLQQVIGSIYRARKIFITGGDLAISLVHFLDHCLTMLELPVYTATTPGKAFYLARSMDSRDLVIAISFRKGMRQTVEALQIAREKGAFCVGITDSYLSHIARNADLSLITSIETASFAPSYAAPMALLNTLLAGCAGYKLERTIDILKQIEDEQRHGSRFYQK